MAYKKFDVVMSPFTRITEPQLKMMLRKPTPKQSPNISNSNKYIYIYFDVLANFPLRFPVQDCVISVTAKMRRQLRYICRNTSMLYSNVRSTNYASNIFCELKFLNAVLVYLGCFYFGANFIWQRWVNQLDEKLFSSIPTKFNHLYNELNCISINNMGRPMVFIFVYLIL